MVFACSVLPKMLFSLLVGFCLCLGLSANNISPHRTRTPEDLKQVSLLDSSDSFTVQWSTDVPLGYRLANFADFTSDSFTQFYNRNKGFPYNTITGDGDVCGLSVVEGFLRFPANDTRHLTDVTFRDDEGDVSCAADSSKGQNGLVATMAAFGCGDYEGNVFQAPVANGFFADNFVTANDTCEFTAGETSYALFVRTDTPPPSPSPSPTPGGGSGSGFICCSYYDFLTHFESDFCQLAGQTCPFISGFTSKGNFPVGSCHECYCS